MNQPAKNDSKPRLTLTRERLRVLGTAELALAVGGVQRPLFGTRAPATDAAIC